MGLPIDMLLLYQHIENLQCIESGFVIDDGGRGVSSLVNFYREGRRERGCASPGGVRSRMLRIPKYSAGTLWLCPVAAPSSLPAGS